MPMRPIINTIIIKIIAIPISGMFIIFSFLVVLDIFAFSQELLKIEYDRCQGTSNFNYEYCSVS